MTAAPELSAVTTENGSSPLYLAASIGSLEMVKAIVRTSQDGTPSPASYSGPEGRRGSSPDLSRLVFDISSHKRLFILPAVACCNFK
jgi:hypothetical protein